MYTLVDTIRSALIVKREVALRLALPDEYIRSIHEYHRWNRGA